MKKLAWRVALRYALETFNYKKEDLVRNPNPKGVKEWVTKEYADQFLQSAPKTSPEIPEKGQKRREFNKRRIEENKKAGSKNLNKFDGLDDKTKARVKALANKKGSEVTRSEVDEFVSIFKTSFDETKSWHEEFIAAGASEYAGRLKDENSLLAKMKGRFSDRTLESVGDVIGNRCICGNIADQNKVIDYIYENCVILEHDDSVTGKVRPDGYRAHHFTLQTKEGRLVEMQVKTANQQLYSGFTHKLYKSNLKNDPEVVAYTKALSDYIFEVDNGRKPKSAPKAPAKVVNFLKETDQDEFDFSELEHQ